MRRRLTLVLGLILVTGALASRPASATCSGNCFNAYKICFNACNGDADCQSACADQFEACRCGCGICP